MKIIGNFFKALFIALLGALFSSITMIGFNFSNVPLETFQRVFWPTSLFCALLGFTGTYTVIAFKKEDKNKKNANKLATARGFWMALSIIFFAMTAKGAYEYITSPLRFSAQMHSIILDKKIKQPKTCPEGNCGLRYDNTIRRHSKFF